MSDIIKSAKEAVEIAKGTKPAARIFVNGHFYVPESKNAVLLESFSRYCKDNPELRFWQALRNWSGFNFICVSQDAPDEPYKDTFYWTGNGS
jgi:hypothetical protein